MKRSICLLGLFLIIISACRHSPDIPENPVISYKAQIEPIVLSNCATSGCHSAQDGRNHLVTYSDVMSISKPGNAHKSKFYRLITALESNRMPPKNQLSEEQIRLIYLWLEQGAKAN